MIAFNSPCSTVITFDNLMTSQHGASTELGEFSERIRSVRSLFGCVRETMPYL